MSRHGAWGGSRQGDTLMSRHGAWGGGRSGEGSRPAPGERRPESFDGAAADYETFRPPYPPDVVQEVALAVGLDRSSRVLEIGCGTGQLSCDLAAYGCELVAVDMGANLAARARKNLARFPGARVEVGSFERWRLSEAYFDLVISASAFHWVAPDVRFVKSAAALKPGGFLVIIHVHHVRGGTAGFFEDTQPHYRKWGLSEDLSFRLAEPAEVGPMYPELDELPQYRSVRRLRLEMPRRLSTRLYVGWLKTDSLVLSLCSEARRRFLEEIAHLIESKYDGEISRNFLYEVIVAERAPGDECRGPTKDPRAPCG